MSPCLKAWSCDALLPLALGTLYAAGFPPTDWPGVTLASLAGLFALWLRAATPARAMLQCAAYALGACSFEIAWMSTGLASHSGSMPLAVGVLAAALFLGAMALFHVAAAALQAEFRVPPHWRAWAVMPALWTLAEWGRSNLWGLGCSWLATGYSQIDTPLAGWARVAGVHGVTFATAVCAGLMAWGLERVLPRAIATPPGRGHRLAIAATVVLALLAGGGAVLRSTEFSRPHAEPFSVALAQGAMIRTDARESLPVYEAMLTPHPALLTILPESAFAEIFQDVPDPLLDGLRQRAAAANGAVLLGATYRGYRDELYNAAVLLDGRSRQVYFKVHLVPGAEYLPAPLEWLAQLGFRPLGLARGSALQAPLVWGEQRLAVLVCYEDVFAGLVRHRMPEATVVVNISNFGYFASAAPRLQQLQMSRMRALESARYLLRASVDGVTAVIDPAGRVVGQLPQGARAVLDATVEGRSGATPYSVVGDYPLLLVCVIMLGAAARLWRRR